MATEEDAVELKSVSIEPNDCPLGDRISIKLGFKTNRAVEKAVWDLKVQSNCVFLRWAAGVISHLTRAQVGGLISHCHVLEIVHELKMPWAGVETHAA
jgi:hypothetical protein